MSDRYENSENKQTHGLCITCVVNSIAYHSQYKQICTEGISVCVYKFGKHIVMICCVSLCVSSDILGM